MNRNMPPPPRRSWGELVARARSDHPPAVDVAARIQAELTRPDPRPAPAAAASGWTEFARLFGQPRGLAACGLGTLAAAACAALLLHASVAELDPFMRLLFFGALPPPVGSLAS